MLYIARLERKVCLSESAQCFHLEFVVDEMENFGFTPGQFISTVAVDSRGKQQTRAYSVASASRGNRFDLCVNRVEGGFFSNHLADLTDLPTGGTVEFYGPHGFFLLHSPLTDSIFISTGTGIAPVRAYVQWLFPQDGPDRSEGKQIWCVFGTRHESEIYYCDEFEALARRNPNFHYLSTLSRADERWTGLRGYVQEHVATIVEQRAAKLNQPLPVPPVDPAMPATDLKFDIYAYVCGLNNMITSVREKLKSYGWHRKQIVIERYD
ncbi:MAG TPA: FAD-dependent oxidoreductase [Terracidiphilus sp.]|jgi:ferredoxin-NADP reductase|nr:FAD-dependent oxidoreductase [Terracidiphilus sp.]